MIYQKHDKVTGEFIYADLLTLDDQFQTDVEKTYHTKMTKKPGWIYQAGKGKNYPKVKFVPDYKNSQDVVVPITIESMKEIYKVKFNSSVYRGGLSLGLFSSICFPYLSLEDWESVSGVSSPKLTKSFTGKDIEAIHENDLEEEKEKSIESLVKILYKDNASSKDVDFAKSQIRKLLTETPLFQNNSSWKKFYTTANFKGFTLAKDIEISGRFYITGILLTDALAMTFDESGSDIYLRDANGKTIVVKMSQSFRANFVQPDFSLYGMLVNRLHLFETYNIELDFDGFDDFTLGDRDEVKEEQEAQDRLRIEKKVESSDSFLEGISNLKFDPKRLKKKTHLEASSLVTLNDNENVITDIVQSGGVKIVRPINNVMGSDSEIRSLSLGFVDTVDTAENEALGRTVNKSLGTYVKNGVTYSTFLDAKSGMTQVQLSPQDVVGKNISSYKDFKSGESIVRVTFNETSRYVSRDQVDYVKYTLFDQSSPARATGVYTNHMDPKRSQMQGKAMEQSRQILRSERPRITSGGDAVIVQQYGHLIRGTVQSIFTEEYSRLGKELPSGIESHTFIVESIAATYPERTYFLKSTSNGDIVASFGLKDKATTKHSVNLNELVPPSLDNTYHWEDIVWANSSVKRTENLEPFNREEFLVDKDANFKDGLGTGRDVLTMFGFGDVYVVDDASYISDKLVRDMGFHTPVYIKKKTPIQSMNPDIVFGFSPVQRLNLNYDSNGRAKVGVYLYPNSVIQYAYEILSDGSYKDRSFKLSPYQEGEILDIKEGKMDRTFHLLSYQEFKVGDKVSGRYGNKSIVSRIVPHEHMPYEKETGRVVEWVINPLGIPSRMNLGQLAEMEASNQFTGTKIEPPFSNRLEEYTNDFTESNLKTIVDGETGKEYPNKMFVGHMHMLRSVHLAADKLRAVGDSDELDPAFLQPDGSLFSDNSRRGQTVGTYELDILLSRGADNVFNEIHSTHTSDLRGHAKFLEEVEEDINFIPNVSIKNNSSESYFDMITSLFVTNETDGKGGTRTAFLRDSKIKEMFTEIDPRNLLNDITDDILASSWSFFRIGEPIINPVAVEYFGVFDDIYVGDSRLTGKIKKVILGATKLYFYMGRLWEKKPNDPTCECITIESIDSLIECIKLLSKCPPEEEWLTQNIPVLPYKYRRNSKEDSVQHDLTQAYLRLVREVTKEKRYIALKELINNGGNNDTKSLYSFWFHKDKNGRLRNQMLKKRVKYSMRANIIPSDIAHPDIVGIPLISAIFMAQPYIVPRIRKDFPRFGENDDHMQLTERIAAMLRSTPERYSELSEGVITSKFQFQQLKKSLYKQLDGRVAIYARAPALQETSARGGYVEVHEDGDVIKLNTLLTADQNADFDGDQEPVVMFFSKEAINDIETKLLPSKTLKRSNDGGIGLQINQDSLLGLWVATISPTEERDVLAISSVSEIENRMELFGFNVSSLIITPDIPEPTTAGKVVIRSILMRETGIDFFEKLQGLEFNSSNLNKFLSELVDMIGDQAFTLTVMDLQRFGYFVMKHNNMTISPKDLQTSFTKSPEFTEAMENIKQKALKANTLQQLGLVPDHFNEILLEDIQSLKENFHIDKHLAPDNMFIKMLKSGAKGKEALLTSLFTCIGTVVGKGGCSEFVLNSYLSGISQLELQEMSHEQRGNALSTVKETSKPGAAHRQSVNQLAGAIVSKDSGQREVYPHLNFFEWKPFTADDLRNPRVQGTFQGENLTGELLRQLAKKPDGVVYLDNGEVLKFDRKLDTLFENMMKGYLPPHQFAEFEEWRDSPSSPSKTFINYFLSDRLSEDYAGVSPETGARVKVGTRLGNKASTALSAPISQAVISKRHGPEEELDVLSSYISTIEHSKIHGNSFKELTRLSPMDTIIGVDKSNTGTMLVFGEEYIFIPIEEESLYHIDVENGDYVFTGQPLVWKKNSKPFDKIHPVLSFATETIDKSLPYLRGLHVFNPSREVVQFARFLLHKHYITLIGANTPIAKVNFATLVFEQLKFGVIGLTQMSKPISELIDLTEQWELRFLSGEKLVKALGSISSFIFRDALGGLKESSAEFTPERSYTAYWVLGRPIPKENFLDLGIEKLSNQVVKRDNEVSFAESVKAEVKVISTNEVNLLDIVRDASISEVKTSMPVAAINPEKSAEKVTVDLASKFAEIQSLTASSVFNRNKQ